MHGYTFQVIARRQIKQGAWFENNLRSDIGACPSFWMAGNYLLAEINYELIQGENDPLCPTPLYFATIREGHEGLGDQKG